MTGGKKGSTVVTAHTIIDAGRFLALAALAAIAAIVCASLITLDVFTVLLPAFGAVAVAAPAPQAAQAQARAIAMVPFVQAAHEHVEGAFATWVVTPGANGVDLGPVDVPAYGYIRHVRLEVTGAGGTLGAGVLALDYPFNLFERLALLDVNGTPIYELDGYATLWANIIGGYAYEQDPRGLPGFVGTINAVFTVRVPVEINHFDGLGAISNQNAAASYKLAARVRPSTQLYSTAPTTPATFTIAAYLEAWSLPNEVDLGGRPQEQYPPMHGTSQYWSSTVFGVNAGAQRTGLTRVGNLIRNLLVIARNTTIVAGVGTRDDTAFPDPATLKWDANDLRQESRRGVVENMAEKITDLVTRDAGVFFYSFSHSELGRAGDGPPSLWLTTVQSSRIEITGNGVVAGTLQVGTNDVAPVEVNPADRFELPNRTGTIVGRAR